MIIHTFLTDGFFDWGVLFLKSLYKFNSNKYRIIIDTRDLNEKQISHLYSLYGNLQINNENFDYKKLSSFFGINEKELQKVKEKVELRESRVTTSIYKLWWKQFVSVDERYNKAFNNIIQNNNEPILHIDIDTYFKNSIKKFEETVIKSDVALIFRLHAKNSNRRIFGTMVGINNNENGRKFYAEWKKIMDSTPLKERRHNFGQTSLYNAYIKLKDKLNWGQFDINEIGNDSEKKRKIIWPGTGSSGGDKKRGLKSCYKDFKKWK